MFWVTWSFSAVAHSVVCSRSESLSGAGGGVTQGAALRAFISFWNSSSSGEKNDCTRSSLPP